MLDQRADHGFSNVWIISQHPTTIDKDLKHVHDLLVWFPL
jgi:hypothetical protein